MARSFIEAHISSHHQRRLLHSLLDHFPEGKSSPYVDIPLLVHGAITGGEEKAIPLTILGKFFFLGMDIIDDISDGDAKDHWPGYSLPELELGSSLRNGTRTLPIVLALEKCTEAEKKILFGPLEKARPLLLSKGISRLTAFIIELYCERARKSLEAANPKKSYQKRLVSYMNNVSLFKKEGETNGLSRYRKAGRQSDKEITL